MGVNILDLLKDLDAVAIDTAPFIYYIEEHVVPNCPSAIGEKMGIINLITPNIDKFKRKKYIKGLIKALSYDNIFRNKISYFSSSYFTRVDAAEALSEIGDNEVIPILISFLEKGDYNDNVCVKIMENLALKEWKPVKASEEIWHLLSKFVNNLHIRWVWELHYQKEGYSSVKYLNNEIDITSINEEILKYKNKLMSIGKSATLPCLTILNKFKPSSKNDSYSYHKITANIIEIIGEISEPDREVIQVIGEYLQYDEGYMDIKPAAIKALERMGQPAIKVLVNYGIKEAIANIGVKESIESLIELWKIELGESKDRFISFDNRKYLETALENFIHSSHESSLEFLTPLFNSEIASIRACIVYSFRIIGEPALDIIIKALQDDPDNDVRKNAAKALGDIKNTKATEALINCLRDNNYIYYIRNEASESLGKIGDISTIDVLRDYLNKNLDGEIDYGDDKSEFLYRRENSIFCIVKSLGEFRDKKALEPLIYAIPYIPEFSITTSIKPGSCGRAVLEALKKIDNEWSMNDTAKQVIPDLITNIINEAEKKAYSTDYRCDLLVASDVLEEIEANWPNNELISIREVIPKLITLMENGGANPKIVAGRMLARIAEKRKSYMTESAIEVLIKALKQPLTQSLISDFYGDRYYFWWEIQMWAAKALGILKSTNAIDPLINILKYDKEYKEVREAALYALHEITGNNFGEAPEDWQKWWEHSKDKFIKSR